MVFFDNLSYGDNGRGQVSFYTNEIEILNSKISRGWSFKKVKKGFWLRAPECWITDITEPKKAYYYGNPIVSFAYYCFIEKLILEGNLELFIQSTINKNSISYSDFNFVISNGLVLEGEVRIIGSDERISNLKDLLFEEFYFGGIFNKFYKAAEDRMGPIEHIEIKKRALSDCSDELKSFYNRIEQLYGRIDDGGRYYNDTIVDAFPGKLPDSDYILFIPSGCFDYLSSFVNDKNYMNVILWEIHADRNNYNNFRCFYRDVKDKRVLIIDKSYSGKTLKFISSFIKEDGGIPSSVALYPKSKYSLKNTDYSILLNRFENSRDVNTSNSEWLKDYYCKAFRGN